MAYSTVVGANLTPWKGPAARNFATAFNRLFGQIERFASAKTLSGELPAFKLFIKAGAPATNTAADNPGSDLCFIWDETNSDLYFVHGWSAVNVFTVLKVID